MAFKAQERNQRIGMAHHRIHDFFYHRLGALDFHLPPHAHIVHQIAHGVHRRLMQKLHAQPFALEFDFVAFFGTLLFERLAQFEARTVRHAAIDDICMLVGSDGSSDIDAQFGIDIHLAKTVEAQPLDATLIRNQELFLPEIMRKPRLAEIVDIHAGAQLLNGHFAYHGIGPNPVVSANLIQ